MDHLIDLVGRLSRGDVAGELWIDGSFVTEKIDPEDVDILLRVPSGVYDGDAAKRTLIDWATHEERWDDHSCDSYKWIEYQAGHPLYADSEDDRRYWTDWFGRSRKGTEKGIAVIELPAAIT
ncbi:MAG TPA: hypothetical protein VGN42_09100 [Pirellulales bacterium]|jgi:hypothetical protein|nr:hypothetical protein [Pirellulales bacterium]